MNMKKIIEDLELQINQMTEGEMNAASWNYQNGVLLTGNEAKQIIEFFGNIEHIINSGKRNIRREIEKLLEEE